MRGKSLLPSKLFAFAYRSRQAAVLRSAPYAVLVHTVSSAWQSRRFGGASTAWWWTWTLPKKLGVSIINLRNCWNKVTMTEFRIKTKDRHYEGLGDNEKMWNGPFCFIQGADPQYGMIDDMGGKKPIGWQAEIELTRKAVAAINKMKPKPKFFVICGDLVHAFPGQDQREEQEADFLKEFAKVDPSIPLVCVCGNHDIGNTPTRKSIQNFRNKFGDDYFGFWAGGVRCLVLNSQLYEDASKVEDLKKEQDIWLDVELEAAKSSGCKHIVLFQHIPWFLQTPEEENEYFNIDKDIRLPMLEKFRAAGVSTIFCGHYHRNAGGSYKGMEEVVTSAMGCPLKDGPAGFEIGGTPSGLRVVKVHETRISHQYYGMDDIPATVDL